MSDLLKRKITFSAWADASIRAPFDRLAAAARLEQLDDDEVVLLHGDQLTAVRVDAIGDATNPTRLRLYALHDESTRPLEYAPGEEPTRLHLADGRYTAFVLHVTIWPDKIVGFDNHPNAPGLTRLSSYFRERAREKVIFRPLYDASIKDRLEELEGIRRVEYGVHDPHKVTRLKNSNGGMVTDLLPAALGDRVPAIRVSMGMSRKSPRDAYLDDAVSENVLQLAEAAENFFDTLHIVGKSKTETTQSGAKKTVRLNLLSQRLLKERELPRDEGESVPKKEVAYRAIRVARDQLADHGALEAAVEARLYLDQQA